MSVEERKAIVRWALQVLWNSGTLEVVDEIVSDDVVVHDGPVHTLLGPQALKDAVAAARAARPGLELRVDEQVAQGELVATRCTATDGERAFAGLGIARFAGGRVVEVWTSWGAG